ncbi:MAG: LVIVD repeat-containing protein [Longimicrobiales bacterium]
MKKLVLVGAFALCPVVAAAQTVEILPSRAHATVGDSVRFKAVLKGANGVVIDTARIFWSAAPFDVAWARADGVVLPVRQGEVQVMAIAGGKVARAVLTVGPKPAATLQLETAVPSAVVGSVLALRATARTSDGENLRDARVLYRSSDERVASVDAQGVVAARALGLVNILAEAGAARAQIRLQVVPNRVARLEVSGVSTARTGDVIRFTANAFDANGQRVSDAPVRWSVSGAGADIHPDGGFVAERPGTFVVSASVGQTAASTTTTATARVHARQLERVYTRVFSDLQAAEHWAIGNVLYVSTIADRVYTFDIRNPASPVLVDSIMVDARTINDVQTTPDGRIGVITREGASSRKNGIVFVDLADPLHPRVISEYTSTVSGGVHSVYIDGHYVYLTDDATGSMRVVDFADIKNPREVARWEVQGVVGVEGVRDPASGDVVGGTVGRMLHDIQVVDGLAYLAYWRHGVIILDVGRGIKGGSPTSPKLVSQYTYNVADLYPADRIAGTHTVFRYKNYLFVGDEVFPTSFNIVDRGRIETMGQVHVLDVSDVERPRKVADYYVAGGAHNVWVDDDVLYIGAYEAGLRALDVSGELRGDLVAQGREMGAVWTGDPKGYRPNLPMAWGAQPHRGVIIVTDINSGLWVARLTPKVAS